MTSHRGFVAFATVAIPLISPPAADRYDERVERRFILEHLEGDGRGAGDDVCIAVRRDELGAALPRVRLRHPLRLVVVATVGREVGAIPPIASSLLIGASAGVKTMSGTPNVFAAAANARP